LHKYAVTVVGVICNLVTTVWWSEPFIHRSLLHFGMVQKKIHQKHPSTIYCPLKWYTVNVDYLECYNRLLGLHISKIQSEAIHCCKG